MSGSGLPALLRLVRYTGTLAITYHPEGPYWSAELIASGQVLVSRDRVYPARRPR